MKKMFYSEVLDKYFDSEEECLRQELVEKKKVAVKKEEQLKTDSRKQAAKEVEEAVKAVSDAWDDLKDAEARAKVAYTQIVTPAKEKLKEAEQKRMKAIQEFNKKFGVYTKRYTGEEAKDEFLRTIAGIEDLFNIFNI